MQAALPASLHDGHDKNWVHSACRHVEPVSLARRKCSFKHFPWFLDPRMVFCNSNYRPAQQCSLRASAPLREVYPVELFQDFCKKMMVVMGLHGQWRVRGDVIPGCGGQRADTTQLQADGLCPRNT